MKQKRYFVITLDTQFGSMTPSTLMATSHHEAWVKLGNKKGFDGKSIEGDTYTYKSGLDEHADGDDCFDYDVYEYIQLIELPSHTNKHINDYVFVGAGFYDANYLEKPNLSVNRVRAKSMESAIDKVKPQIDYEYVNVSYVIVGNTIVLHDLTLKKFEGDGYGN